jgi:hypothetical protein
MVHKTGLRVADIGIKADVSGTGNIMAVDQNENRLSSSIC